MPDAVAVAIAKAVTSELAAATLSQTFTPERSYADWNIILETDENELHVDVVLVTTEQSSEQAARSAMKFLAPIDIAVRKKFSQADYHEENGRVAIAKVDDLLLLVQEIHVLFTRIRLTSMAAASWVETKTQVAPIIEHLRDGQFTAIVRVTFTAFETI